MNEEKSIVIVKAICYIIIGAGTSLASGLSQWSNSDNEPNKINWIIIIGTAAVAAATQLASFLSNAYANYQAGKATPQQQKP